METNMEQNYVKGFKVFHSDWSCDYRNVYFKQYACPGTFEEDVVPKVCNRGMHFCENLADCFDYYRFNPNNKVAEVIALGNVDSDGKKSCTNKLQIVRELSWEEVLKLVNTGNGNTGYRNIGNYNSGSHNKGDFNKGCYNTGNCNSGDSNTGDCNNGDSNTGNYNSGDYNTGNYNSGDYNTGNRNSGHFNEGDCNSGNDNTGYNNSGDHNTGNCNSGYCNAGNYNSGDSNYGDWNSGRLNRGCFNTNALRYINAKFRMFNKKTDWNLDNWRQSEACQILKNAPQSDERQQWWDTLTESDKKEIMSLPNFDADIFYEITDIRV